LNLLSKLSLLTFSIFSKALFISLSKISLTRALELAVAWLSKVSEY
jgi:hypothetical protein